MLKLSEENPYNSVVQISGEFYDGMKKIQEEILGDKCSLMDVALFAWSVGVNKNKKVESSDFKASKKHKKINPLSPLGNYREITQIEVLLEEMGEIPDKKLGVVFNEYVNGGLRYLIEEEFHLGKIERFMKKMNLEEKSDEEE